MRLTYFSDYALRLTLYLAVHPDRLVPVQEVSRAYGISQNHLVKVVQLLVANGLVTSVRGRRGGLRLNKPPGEINVGKLVRLTEPDFYTVECFDRQTNTCPIEPACGLKRVFTNARDAFLSVLDASTLADFVPRGPSLIRLWSRNAADRPSAA